MLSVFDPLRELTMASLLFRLLLALACGSVIGYGRSQKNCAAGLWATGIIGVALGSGYFEGGFLAALLVIVTEAGLFKLGDSIKSRPDFSVELRYNDKTSLDQVLHYCKDQHMSIRTRDNETPKYVATVRLRGSAKAELLMRSLRKMPGIVTAEMEE